VRARDVPDRRDGAPPADAAGEQYQREGVVDFPELLLRSYELREARNPGHYAQRAARAGQRFRTPTGYGIDG
jgi:hypothetical protein